MKNIIIYLVSLSCILSCSYDTEQMDPLSYLTWMTDLSNSFKQTKNIGDLNFTLQYKTSDYIIAMETLNKHYSKEQYTKRKMELEGMEYFTFTIQNKSDHTHSQSATEMLDMKEYASFEMEKDFSLIVEKDTVKPGLYLFEQQSEINNTFLFLLAFPKQTNSNKKITFSYDDNLFDTGIINYVFQQEDLESQPTMLYK